MYVVVCLECVRLGQWLVKQPPLMEMSPVSLPDSLASLTPMAHSDSAGPSVDTDAGVSQAGVFTKKVLSQQASVGPSCLALIGLRGEELALLYSKYVCTPSVGTHFVLFYKQCQ